MTTDLWSEASRDLAAERHDLALETAKAASGGLWAFLALAGSKSEFEDRLAVASDRIQTTASGAGADPGELVALFRQRFALLMEAGSLSDFPHGGDEDSDSDDSDDDSSDDDSDSDDGSDDDDDSDDSDSDSDDNAGDGADDVDEQTDKDDDGDKDNADDSDKGKDQDPDQEKDEAEGKDKGISPWSSRRYAGLAARIAQGEDPLAWGGTPFVRSSARKVAADGAPVSDVNNPTPADPMSGGAPAPVPGMEGGIAETTKPRQMPEGGGMNSPGMGMDGIDDNPSGADTADPGLNGGDIEQGANDLPEATASRKIAVIAAEVRKYNPGLSDKQVQHVAFQAYETYLSKHAEDMSPLLFGDRGNVEDGPLTHKVKTWSPPDVKPPGAPGGGSGSEGGGGGGLPKMLPGGAGTAAEEGAAGAAGAGEAAGAGAALGEAAELLPLLAL